ncbi:MAG: ABC transporter ATP-binding protein, partial [Micrococcales bacterium]|nr:ABC transporter ATP-binding protein [Micrococcales bacterium]
ALARALAPEPALVLLDEPFSSLDAGLREDTGRAVARALQAGGATAVLVTHDQQEALSLADTVAVMVEGRFLQVSHPADVYLHPATSTIASFVGNTNLLPAEAAGATAQSVLGQVRLSSPQHGPIRISVRPEQVLMTQDESPASPNAEVLAQVHDVSFYGHDAIVRLLPLGPADDRAAVSDGRHVSVRVSSGPVPQVGATVRLRVDGPVRSFGEAPPHES